MKRISFFILNVIACSAIFVGCNKDDVAIVDDGTDSQVIKSDVENVDVSKLNKTAVARFDNIKKIVFATGINKSDDLVDDLVTKSGEVEVEEPTIAELWTLSKMNLQNKFRFSIWTKTNRKPFWRIGQYCRQSN